MQLEVYKMRLWNKVWEQLLQTNKKVRKHIKSKAKMELGTDNVEQLNKKIRPTMSPSITTYEAQIRTLTHGHRHS